MKFFVMLFSPTPTQNLWFLRGWCNNNSSGEGRET